MKTKLENDNIKLARFLSGEMNPAERLWFLAIMSISRTRRREYDATKQLYSKMIGRNDHIEFDTNKAWDKLKSRIISENQKEVTLGGYHLTHKLIGVAASLALLIVLAVSGWLYFNPKSVKVFNLAQNHTIITTLPDGSQVFLGQGAVLEYPKRFVRSTRTVRLSGEAFFDVIRNPKQPFIIETSKASIKVVGTSFNLKSSNSEVHLNVIEGRVQITLTETNESKLVNAGEMALAIDSRLITAKQVQPTTVKSAMQILLFQDERIDDIIRVINGTYGASIKVQGDELREMRISVTFDNDISSIVNTLSVSFNLKVTYSTDGSIILSK